MDKYAQLLAEMTAAGTLGTEWRSAFERAPRSAFLPNAVWTPDPDEPTGYRRTTLAADPEGWWALANADDVVVTQVDDGTAIGPGVATSSASVPTLVAVMLRHLDVVDGHTVLDVGTGTGWTSALLCARLGDHNVTTIEVDPNLAAEAAHRLRAAGFAPTCAVGDGLAGWPLDAPYDRIHSTAAVQRIPLPWLRQTRPGGVIVTPWGTPYANAGLLRLTVGAPDAASHGRFVDAVSFMWMRAHRPDVPTAAPAAPTAPTHLSPSAIDPDLALETVHAAFAIGLRVPGVRYQHRWDPADPSTTYRIQLTDAAGSLATARHHRWQAPDAVRQSGPRRLWDEVTAARSWWLEDGRPDLTRFGVTVDPDGTQTVWLDDPDHPVT
ncbi:methyltransferase domain-containing protein [Kitasatospora albolonga]|uniref:methyltransferase domain-containing protein n=1 Tax=Kitasatospora albolonga TaxID=68173 RepID=UPI0031EA9787